MLANTTEVSRPHGGGRTLQRLRREAGYRSAKDFAQAIGMPATTYARYERQEDGPDRSIPLPTAWKLADELGCSIDFLVGRTGEESRGEKVQRTYNALSESHKERFDEYLDFIEYREHVMAQQRRWNDGEQAR